MNYPPAMIEALNAQVPRPLIDASGIKPGDGFTAPLRIVLARKGNDEFVTWMQNVNTGGCMHGNYFHAPYYQLDDEIENARRLESARLNAHEDFADRIRKLFNMTKEPA